MSKVFVIQEDPHKNLVPAKQYGGIVVLLPFGQVSFDASSAVEIMIKKLEDFDFDKDFLLLVGDPVLISIASAIVSRATGGIYNVLKWDRQEATYNVVEIDIGEP